jgi:hypothetical protein
MTPPKRRSIYSNEDLEKALKERVSPSRGVSATITRVCSRYADLVLRELEGVDLSLKEWLLICDACHKWFLDGGAPTSYDLLAIEVESNLRRMHLDKKWGVDVEALLQKLRSYRYGQLLAIVDTMERFQSAKQNNFEGPDESLFLGFCFDDALPEKSEP